MTTRYVAVNRETFCSALSNIGFTPDPEAKGELVYIRQHHLDPTMFVKIFTSIPLVHGNARSCGADAIRVLLIFKNSNTGKTGCLYKSPRVYRTGSESAVIERTIQRAREAYKSGSVRAREYMKK